MMKMTIEDSRDTGIIDNESDDESELEDDSIIDSSKLINLTRRSLI